MQPWPPTGHILRAGSISHLTERPPSHTSSHETAAISQHLWRETKSTDVCPFLSLPPSYSGPDHREESPLPLPLFWRESEAVSPDKLAATLWCSEVGGATAPQSDSHLVGEHGFTTERQPSCWGTQLHPPRTAHSTGAVRSRVHPR